MHTVVIIPIHHAPLQTFHICCTHLRANKPAITTVMQSTDSLNSSTGEPELPELTHLHTEAFQITPNDAEVLKGYIDEFQYADTQMRNTILEKAMGDVYRHRPGNSPFDKKDAKQVSILSMTI